MGKINKFILRVFSTFFLTLAFSVKAEYAMDGPPITVIGFPFIWAMDGVNSLSVIISLPGFVGNWFMNTVLLWFPLRWLQNFISVRKLYKAGLFLVMMLSILAFMIIVFINDIYLVLWLGDVFSQDLSAWSAALFPFVN